MNAGLAAGRGRTGSSGGDGSSGSVWHVHYYTYPLLSWIGALLDLGCLESGGLDIAWVSELDPTWNDEELALLVNPEAVLFADLPAQAACAADCAAASTGLPRDELFWCAGCQGGMYPLTGAGARTSGACRLRCSWPSGWCSGCTGWGWRGGRRDRTRCARGSPCRSCRSPSTAGR